MGFKQHAAAMMVGGSLALTIGCGGEGDSRAGLRGDSAGLASPSVELLAYLPPNRSLDVVMWYEVNPAVDAMLEPVMAAIRDIADANPEMMEEVPPKPITADVVKLVTGRDRAEGDEPRVMVGAYNLALLGDPEYELMISLVRGSFSDSTVESLFGNANGPRGPESITEGGPDGYLMRVSDDIIAGGTDEMLLSMISGDGSGLQALRPAFLGEIESLAATYSSGAVFDNSPDTERAMGDFLSMFGGDVDADSTLGNVAMVAFLFDYPADSLRLTLRVTTTGEDVASGFETASTNWMREMGESGIIDMIAAGLPTSFRTAYDTIAVSSSGERFNFSITLPSAFFDDLAEMIREQMP